MTEDQKSQPRLLTPEELAALIKLYREMRQWSQEQLADISGLNVRTIQRVERGDGSGFDTRRALARAFELEDIDALNKPFLIPTVDEMKAQKEKFEREHVTLKALPLDTGRQLARLAESHSMDLCTPGFEMPRAAEEEFAALVDYMREYRDCNDLYSETQKLDVYDDMQRHLDGLKELDVSLRYAERKVRLRFRSDAEAEPFDTSVLYLVTFPVGKEPDEFATPRSIGLEH
ncbi:helix-turn-helix domain-containing protein [Paraburkholderia sp. C35]|uniref:helix-turn-helix domain-containing protein n=1 Tax=Paraburkholderia sp. C35 TaxID=2126993 RepID=UPI000D691A7A|nr:helix-turn-helix domain-containing protein [Paraburkholderia sp. C35]